MSIIESALHRTKAAGASQAAGSALEGDDRKARPRSDVAGITAPVRPRNPAGPMIDLSTNTLIEAGLVPRDPISMRRQVDEFRAIKRPLLNSIFGQGAAAPESSRGSVLITSALPDEGKSYTSLHLAVSLAQEQACEVTLIDADAPRRTLSEMLNARRNQGLLEYLSDPQRQLDESLSPTSIPSLRFMSAGVGSGEMATEMFAGSRMQALLETLCSGPGKQIVVIDSAPVLVTSETPVLAKAVGQLLMVVRSVHTVKDVVLEAVARLQSDRPMGLILNRWSPIFFAERQYYGQYYGPRASDTSAEGGRS